MKHFVIHGGFAFSGLFLALLFLFALFPQLLTPYSFETQDPYALLQTPNFMHWLGTDELGRDLLARILYGARISLSCAILATVFSALVGMLYGGMAGTLGGKWDLIFMRLLDILYSIPDLLLFILLGIFLGRSFWGLLIALSSLSWITVARVTRGEILKYKKLPFIEATHALGTPSYRIFFKHLIPQMKEPILVTLLFKIPSIILAESSLSFIGLGLKPPYSSWGTLASEGYSALSFFPHLILFPSLIIFLTIFSFQTLGAHVSRTRM